MSGFSRTVIRAAGFSRTLSDIGVLHHHHGIRASGHHAAGRNRHGRPATDDGRGHDGCVNDLFREIDKSLAQLAPKRPS